MPTMASLFRKRREAEEITPIPGPPDGQSSSIEKLKGLTDFDKIHKLDPNMPIDDLNEFEAAIATGNDEKGFDIEHALMEDNSPYPEVCDNLASAGRQWRILVIGKVG
jgi:hypothetical protein